MIKVDQKSESEIIVTLSNAHFGHTKLRITNTDDFREIKVIADDYQKDRVLFRRGNKPVSKS